MHIPDMIEWKSDEPLSSFQLGLDGIVEEVRRRWVKVVALQLPEGLKRRALEMTEIIEEATDATVVVSADPCYGACDLVDDLVEPLGVELIVHVGHTQMGDVQPRIPTIFLDAPSRLDVGPAVRSALPLLGVGGRIGLLTTTQHRHVIPQMEAILEAAGFRVDLGKGGRRLAFPGQVLGCDLSAARDVAGQVDTFLIVGGGTFHAVGVAMATRRPVVMADVETGQARKLDEDLDRVLRRRSAVIVKAMEAQTFGIIVEGRPGQQRWDLARSLRDMLIDAERRPVLMIMRDVSPQRLVTLGMDAYVNTACPRLAVDDQSAYPMPILTPQELRLMLGETSWDSYVLDEIS